MNWQKFFTSIIEYSFYGLFFLVPLVLTPYNYELFEFNKMMLVYALTIIIIGAWIATWIVNKKISIERTPLDIPILLFLASQILSTVFSIDRHTSIWGYYSRFHGGLLSTISYIVLYYAFVSNIDNILNCLYFLLGSAGLVTFYGVLEHFGIDAKYWVQDVRNRVFSTLGQPNWLGAWIDGIIFIPVALILKRKKIFFFLLFAFAFCLLFTGSRSAYFGFFAGLAVFLSLLAFFNKGLRKLIFLIPVLILISAVLVIPKTRESIKEEKPTGIIISSSTDIRKVVWQGAIRVWQHYPIFGSGVETFAYSYYNFRLRSHNDLSEWDFLYNKAHNEYLNYLATTGIFGLSTYFLMIGWFLIWSLKKIFNKNSLEIRNLILVISILAGYVSILATNFFGFSVVPVAILFWLFPAFVFVLTDNKTAQPAKGWSALGRQSKQFNNLSIFQKLFLLIILFFIFYFLYFICRFWWADYKFAQGKKYSEAGYLLAAQQLLTDAVKLNIAEPLYHSYLADNSAAIAAAYWQKDASASADLIDQLVQLSIAETAKTLDLNKVHVNYYKTAAKTYIYLGAIKPEFNSEALTILQKSGELSPTDPKIFLNIALLEQNLGANDQALANLEKTVQLKPNYTTARLTLAKFYHNLGKVQKAKEQLIYILDNIEADQPEAKELLKAWGYGS